jgi:hypothetical protein
MVASDSFDGSAALGFGDALEDGGVQERTAS